MPPLLTTIVFKCVDDRIYLNQTMAKGLATKQNSLTKEILFKLALAGCFVIASTSPFFLTRFLQSYFKDKLKRTLWRRAALLKRLAQKKIVSFNELKNGSVKIELTQHGRKWIRQYKLEDMKVETSKGWDKKWRLIFYDIPEYNKKARQALSQKLRDLHLYRFQKSLWVSAYECLPELEFICSVFNIDLNRHIFYLETASIPKEKEVKTWFGI